MVKTRERSNTRFAIAIRRLMSGLAYSSGIEWQA